MHNGGLQKIIQSMIREAWVAGPASLPVQDGMGFWVSMQCSDAQGVNGLIKAHLFGLAVSAEREIKLLSSTVAVVAVVPSFGANNI